MPTEKHSCLSATQSHLPTGYSTASSVRTLWLLQSIFSFWLQSQGRLRLFPKKLQLGEELKQSQSFVLIMSLAPGHTGFWRDLAKERRLEPLLHLSGTVITHFWVMALHFPEPTKKGDVEIWAVPQYFGRKISNVPFMTSGISGLSGPKQ